MRSLSETVKSFPLRLIVLATLVALAVGTVAFLLARPYFETSLRAETNRRAELFRTTLEQALSQFQHLPLILKDDPVIVGAFYGVGLDEINRRLSAVSDRASVDAVYLMDENGLTIAASNHAAEQSFLGQNYGFRPYFKEAMRGLHGTFFAIGATTRRPGYFIADGVQNADGAFIGVIAVKIDLAPLVESWARSGETVFVSNADDIIVLSSMDALRYRTLTSIDPFRRDEIAAERQFADEPLEPLHWQILSQGRVVLDGITYQQSALRIGDHGWTLHFLSSLEQVTERAWLVTIVAVLVLAVLTVLSLTLRSVRMRAALASSQEARRALITANTELRRAQDELKRTSKLAALGQMAASVTHELGQPISALRNHLVAVELTDESNGLIAPVGGIVRRMEAITKQLRFFASPSSDLHALIALGDVVAGATALVRHDAEVADVTLCVQIDDSILVKGDRLRLEQVLVNLLRNAIAAVDGRDLREVNVTGITEEQQAVLSVSDTGPGLDGRTISQLAEPFHTTRESGTGMGLGLAISVEIVREHGGQMSARDAMGGGAVFIISLPIEPKTHG